MKKNFKALVVALFALLLLIAVPTTSRADKPRKGKPADAKTLSYTPKHVAEGHVRADGNLGEWGAAKPIHFETIISGEYEYDWTSPRDLSADLTVLYSPLYLHLLLQVKDNVVTGRHRRVKGDRVELWFAVPQKRGHKIYGLLVDIGPTAQNKPPTLKWLAGGKKKTVSQIELFATALGNGYDFEISIPLALLNARPAVVNGDIGFCALVRDWDADDDNEDEVAIATCPIHPRKSKRIKNETMGKLHFNYLEEIWKALQAQNEALVKNETTFDQAMDLTPNAIDDYVHIQQNNLAIITIADGQASIEWSWQTLPIPQNARILEVKKIKQEKKDKLQITYRIEGDNDRHQYICDDCISQ